MRSALLTLLLMTAVFGILLPATAPAQAAGNFGLDATVSVIEKKQNITFAQSPIAIIAKIVNAALALVGIIFFVLMLYAGFLWMTARGNEKAISSAKDAIVSASIGLVIIAGAYAITNLVFNSVTGETTSAPAEEEPEIDMTGDE